MDRKVTIVLGVLAVMLMFCFIGCSADAIMNTGKALGNLEDANLGSRNSKAVNEATESVKGFTVAYEATFDWEGAGELDFSGAEDPKVIFISNDDTAYRKVVDETTLAVLKAKVSGAKDGSLRAALNEKYVGKYSEAKEYKNTLEGLHRTPVIGGFLTLLENSETIKFLIQILNLDPSLAEQAGNIPDVLQNTDSPIPLRSFDYNIFADKILLRLEDVKKMVENRNGAGKPVKIDLQVLLDFHNDVKASVGSRDYQTVGDKLAVGILYNLLSAVCDVIDAYKETPEYKEAESFEGFDANWIMANISDKVDTVMGYIDAIGYIYDCKLDVAGLVGGMID